MSLNVEGVFALQKPYSVLLRSRPIRHRKENLKKLRKWIFLNKEAIRAVLYEDLSKPHTDTDLSEIYVVTHEIGHALKNLNQWTKSKKADTPVLLLGTRSVITTEPKGVCLIISPWNFPFNLALGPLVSALAAGNTAIIKPSEMTPATSALIARMAEELFKQEEVAVFTGGVAVSQALLMLPFDHIFFTGSPQVGKIVMEAAAKNLSSVTLELGGKSPAIVDDTVSIKDAAKKVAWGKFLNCGQTCIAPDYIMVHQKVATAFVAELSKATATMFGDVNNDYARIVNKRHFQRLSKSLKQAVDQGASIVSGGTTDAEHLLIAPTILNNVSEESDLMQEEIFGPLLPVMVYDDLDEVIAYINQRPKPLALYVFSNSRRNQKKILSETSSGTACINDALLQFSQNYIPFGGVNFSGIGKAHGYFGFLAFSNQKPILRQRVGFTLASLVYPPYNSRVRALVAFLTRYF